MLKFDKTFDFLASATPVILMSGLVMFSFVLLKQTNYQPQSKVSTAQNVNDQDYYLTSFNLSRYSGSGQLNAYIKGKHAEHFEKLKELSVFDFEFFFIKESRIYLGKSSQATVNDDANTVAMSRGVKIFQKVKE